MKISHIQKDHIEAAAKIILKNKVQNSNRGIYKVTVNNKEYDFKQLIRVAHNQTEGNEQDWLDFQSKKEYRDYVEQLGYPIGAQNKKIPFFSSSDILDISNNSLKTYNPNDPGDRKLSEEIKQNAWAKTSYWLTLLNMELESYKTKIIKNWAQRNWDNGKKVSAFKSYTWAKIYKEGDDDKHIYFTIGIDGYTKSLLIKIDFKRVGTSLTKNQKDLCQRLINTVTTEKIPIKDLHSNSWETLIEKTINFITDHSDTYTKIIDEVWSTNQRRIARLAFNTNGWVFPSGPYGKSTHPDSHEARHGYGHEEWLLDTSKIINGYHYGFLEPIRKQQGAYQENIYDVWLYTIDGVAGKRFWIGEISNVEVLNKEQADEANNIYKLNGWLNEMEGQIRASGGNDKGFSNWKGVDLFNIRFKVGDIFLNDEYVELPSNHQIYNLSRYSFAHFKEEYIIKDKDIADFSDDFFDSETNSTSDKKARTSNYIRKAKAIEITYLHNEISDKLAEHLKNIYGESNVKIECNAGYDSNRIDIVVRANNQYIFYEIKTYPTLKSSIREAIGQLLEYCMWTNHKRANELIIVTQPHKNYEKVEKYLNHLRSILNINLYYQSFDLDTNTLSEKL